MAPQRRQRKQQWRAKQKQKALAEPEKSLDEAMAQSLLDEKQNLRRVKQLEQQVSSEDAPEDFRKQAKRGELRVRSSFSKHPGAVKSSAAALLRLRQSRDIVEQSLEEEKATEGTQDKTGEAAASKGWEVS